MQSDWLNSALSPVVLLRYCTEYKYTKNYTDLYEQFSTGTKLGIALLRYIRIVHEALLRFAKFFLKLKRSALWV